MADRTSVFTILTGASVSNEITVGNDGLIAIQMPSAWTAAGIYVQARLSDTAGWETFKVAEFATSACLPAYVAAAHVLVSGVISFSPPIAGVYSLRLVSGVPGGAAVNQAADRVITPSWRRIF